MTEERRREAGRRDTDEEILTAQLVIQQATNEIVELRQERDEALEAVQELQTKIAGDTQRLREAGDELASSLARSPGIDPMRSVLLTQWRDAKTSTLPIP
jgi:chromosome segregation ATPase